MFQVDITLQTLAVYTKCCDGDSSCDAYLLSSPHSVRASVAAFSIQKQREYLLLSEYETVLSDVIQKEDTRRLMLVMLK